MSRDAALPRLRWTGTAVLAAALAGVAVASLAIGAVRISPGQIAAVLASPAGISLPWEFGEREALVVLGIRLPRVVLGVLVGGGLAVSGAAMQGLFRNPLADPGLLGVSSGAAFAAVCVIVLGGAVFPALPPVAAGAAVSIASFAGGLVAVLAVYRVATRDGRTSVPTMLLAGIAVNALAAAAVGVVVLGADDQQLRDFTFWTFGGLGGATWPAVGVGGALLALGVVAVPGLARPLNALLLGEAEAQHLGVDVQRVKRRVVVLSALLVGAAVALAGIIGFVGLVAPHLVRLTLGPDHRVLLPASALLGATLLLAADLASRTIVSPTELPVGIVTALLGGPFFLWILVRGDGRGTLAGT